MKMENKQKEYLYSKENLEKLKRISSHPAWSKGLTKEIDDRLKKLGQKIKKNAKNNPKFGNRQKIKKNAGYNAIHIWIKKRKFKLDYCEICGGTEKRIELANISGVYSRNINDYRWVCSKCHRDMDGNTLVFKSLKRDGLGRWLKLEVATI